MRHLSTAVIEPANPRPALGGRNGCSHCQILDLRDVYVAESGYLAMIAAGATVTAGQSGDIDSRELLSPEGKPHAAFVHP